MKNKWINWAHFNLAWMPNIVILDWRLFLKHIESHKEVSIDAPILLFLYVTKQIKSFWAGEITNRIFKKKILNFHICIQLIANVVVIIIIIRLSLLIREWMVIRDVHSIHQLNKPNMKSWLGFFSFFDKSWLGFC